MVFDVDVFIDIFRYVFLQTVFYVDMFIDMFRDVFLQMFFM